MTSRVCTTWERPARRLVLLATLVGALIVGLVAMHQLAGGGCCTDPSPATATTIPTVTGAPNGGVVGHAGHTRVVGPTTVSSPSAHPDGHEHGDRAGLLGACLALVAGAGALLVLTLVRLGRGALRTGARRPLSGPLVVAAPCDLVLPRRLARLQVLRL